MYANANKPQSEMTASPSKYPQGKFKDKPCKYCGEMFSPMAPSHLYCSQECTDNGWSDGYLKNTYGISHKQYRGMLDQQGGVCAICGGDGFLMREHHKNRLVVDHDHKTGKVRGLLCHNCNRGIGLLQDSQSTLNSAIKYLERATTIPEGSTLK